MCLGLMMFLGLQSCSSSTKPGTDPNTGRYVETELMIPEDTIQILDIKQDNGTIMMIAIVEGNDTLLWSTDDYGVSWKECMSTPESLKESVFMTSVITKENDIICGVYYDLLEKQGQEVDLMTESFMYFTIRQNGELKEQKLSTLNGSMIVKLTTYEDQVFAYDSDGYLYELTDNNLRCINPNMEPQGTPYDFVVYNGKLLVLYGDGIKEYDSESGECSNEYQKFRDLCAEKISTDGDAALLGVGTSGELYYFGAEGLFSYDQKAEKLIEILSGNMYQYSDSDNMLQKLVPIDDIYLVLGMNRSGSIIYKYEYDAQASTSEETVLKIYTLKENNTLQSIIDGFKEKYPSIQVELEVGFEESSELTLEDSIRALNVSLFAENGPDILLLDNLPYESYIKQGSLKKMDTIVEIDALNNQVLDDFITESGTYGIPIGYTILDMHGKKDVMKQADSLQHLSEVLMQNQKKEHVSAVDLWESNSNFGGLFYYYFTDCLGNTNQVNEEELRIFFQSMKQIYDSSTYNWTVEQEGEAICNLDYAQPGNMQLGDLMLYVGESQLMVGELQTTSDILLAALLQAEGYDSQFIQDYGKTLFFPQALLAISSSTTKSKEAEQFVQYALSEEGQERVAAGYTCFPIHKDVFKRTFVNYDYEYTMDDQNNREISLNSKKISNKELESLKKRATEEMTLAYPDTTVKTIIMRFLEDYINGEMTLDQAVQQCIQSINLYLNE